MAFRNKASIIDVFGPDIAIIQECESEEVLNKKHACILYESYVWVGKNKNKGLGIFSFNGYKIELLDHNKAFEYILPIRVYNENTEILLLAVWTQFVNKSIYESYVVQAVKAFEYYMDTLNYPIQLIVGDFNSNAIWDFGDAKEYNHSYMVEMLKKNKIISVYHLLNKEDQGKESIPTLYLRKNLDTKYHVDYMYINEELLPMVKDFNIGDYETYIEKSDHMPLFLELDIP